MAQGNQMNKEVSAIDDLRHTAYAYQKAFEKEKGNENDLKNIFREMDTNRDDQISFGEFQSYMRAKGYTTLCSDEQFFDKLACQRGYLKYCDVVTLIYIVNSGRPYCDMCRYFIQGSFFTCVSCFEEDKEYRYNLCPNCYGSKDKMHDHHHKEFVDPLSLLRLIAKRESVKLNPTKPSDSIKHLSTSSSSSIKSKTEEPSSRLEIIVQHPQDIQMNRPGAAMNLMQYAVGCSTILAAVSQFCTIM